MNRLVRSQKGTALIETALTLPLLLLVSVGIFEFGRAYQTWEVLTNAAREGARIAVLPTTTSSAAVISRVQQYMQDGSLPNAGTATVVVDATATIDTGDSTAPATRVTVSYPFQFMVLQPVVRLIDPNSTAGAPLTMTASALMRNEM